MSYHLFLDDVRMPGDASWVRLPSARYDIVRNYDEFVEFIQERGVPEFVSFDHDLAAEHYRDLMDQSANDMVNLHYDNYEERTGYDCLKWLLDFCSNENLRRPIILMHTMNPVGRDNMRSLIANTKHR